MQIKQIRSKDGTGALSYLIFDEQTNKAVIIDPNIEDLQNIGYLLNDMDAELLYVIDTHTHADHISAAGELKSEFGAKLIMHENTKNKWKVVDEGDKFGIGDILRINASNKVDVYVNDGEVIQAGTLEFKVILTPGHTDNHIALLVEDKLFTGDVLLIGQAGRSDLPGGNTPDLYNSLYKIILKLPDKTEIFPGHDYEDNISSFLEDEKKNNPFLQIQSKEEFVNFVKDFFPPVSEDTMNGRKTLQCGVKRVIKNSNEPFANINASELAAMIKEDKDLFLLDVREPFELMAFGVIPGVRNIPIGELIRRMNELPENKTTPVAVVCQSGNRSYEAAYYLSKQGYSNVFNLEGGTSGWVYSNDPLVQSIS